MTKESNSQNKKSFILHADLKNVVDKLPDETKGKLFQLILDYANGLEYSIDNLLLSVMFEPIKTQLDMDRERYRLGRPWNWKGGISSINQKIRNSYAMKLWREQVFKRDNYFCQKCHKFGGLLHAHHIKPFAKFPELRIELSNGITLCKKCHIQEHKKNA